MRRSYKFLLRPTRKQEAALGACLEDTRQLYNAALEERREAWRRGRHRVTFYSQDAQLKEISIFLRILSAKAESAGRQVIAVDPRHTSLRCAQCGHTAAGNRISQAEFRCLACGHHAHADVNAAINVLRAGLVLQEAHNAA